MIQRLKISIGKKIIILIVVFFYLLISINKVIKNQFLKLELKSNSSIETIFDHFFNHSSEQKLIPKEIIFKTMRYMMEERDEYDPELVDFVRSLIVGPPIKSKAINLSIKNKSDFSQSGQSLYFDRLLNEKRNGFFIESGGLDGELYSNTLFFEIERGWSGILIEPIPSFYNKILSKNRQIYAINACIANKKPHVAKFRVSEFLSSRTAIMRKEHESRINKIFGKKEIYVYSPCFSLNTILKALKVNRVDYFSLDVEGGEYSVLDGLDFKNINFTALTIEYNKFEDAKKKILLHMEANHYKLIKDDKRDLFFLKN